MLPNGRLGPGQGQRLAGGTGRRSGGLPVCGLVLLDGLELDLNSDGPVVDPLLSPKRVHMQ